MNKLTRYNASDIQPRVTAQPVTPSSQDERMIAFTGMLSDAIAQRLQQPPQQQQPTTHIHYHVKEGNGLGEAMLGLVVVVAIAVGAITVTASALQGLRSELPTVEEVG